MALRERLLLQETLEFDRARFDQDEWQLADWRDQKTRHIMLHIAKIPLKIVSDSEQIIVEEVIPDLALYRSQLINVHRVIDIDLGEVITSEGNRNIRCADFILHHSAIAMGHLATYLEPLEHNKESVREVRMRAVQQAVVSLHDAAQFGAQEHGISLPQSHLKRMERHLGHPLL